MFNSNEAWTAKEDEIEGTHTGYAGGHNEHVDLVALLDELDEISTWI